MKIKNNVKMGGSEPSTSSDGIPLYKELNILNTTDNPLSVANKAYVDETIDSKKYSTGDLLIKATSNTPTNFLKCNGVLLDKLLYPELYSVIGDKFNVYSAPGNGVPWRNQYGFNEILNSSFSTWNNGTSLPASNMFFQVIVTKNKVYALGRFNNISYTANCYIAPIDSQGVIGDWITSELTLPSALGYSQLITYLNKAYLVGGNNGTHQSVFYRSSIDTDGNLSSFTTLPSLPFTLSEHRCVFIKNHLFIIGGYHNGIASNKAYINHISSLGDPTTWYDHQSRYGIGNLPYALTNHITFIINRRVYLIGGLIDGNTATNNIYYNDLDDNSHLTEWKQYTPFPEVVYNANFIISNNKLYIIGGNMSGSITNKIYYTDINDDYTLGTWESGGTLPDTLSGCQVLATSSKIYVLGGHRGTNVISNTYYVNLPGGLNDYSPYYDGSIGYTPVGFFKLPDYTSYEKSKLYFFIKY